MKIRMGLLLVLVSLLTACAGVSQKSTNTNSESKEGSQIVFEDTPEGAKLSVPNEILFPVSSSNIRPESKEFFDRLKFALDKSTGKILVKGHTDNTGKATKNKVLSLDRAKAVERELISRGVTPSRIDSQGYGSSMPKVANATTPEDHQKNRRAEVIFTENTKEQLGGDSFLSSLRDFGDKLWGKFKSLF